MDGVTLYLVKIGVEQKTSRSKGMYAPNLTRAVKLNEGNIP
jgi:hypothetical protein